MSPKTQLLLLGLTSLLGACSSPGSPGSYTEVHHHSETTGIKIPGLGVMIPPTILDVGLTLGKPPQTAYCPGLVGTCFGMQFYGGDGKPLGDPAPVPILPGGGLGTVPTPQGAAAVQPFAYDWQNDNKDSTGVQGGDPTPVDGRDFYSWGLPVTPGLSVGSLVIYHQMTLHASDYQAANADAHGLEQAIEDAFDATGTISMPSLPTFVHEAAFVMLALKANGDVVLTVAAPGTTFVAFDVELNGIASYAALGTPSVVTSIDGQWILAQTVLHASDLSFSNTAPFENSFRVSYQTDGLPRAFEDSHSLLLVP